MSKWKSETTDLISRAQIVDFVAEIIKRPEADANAATEFSSRATALIAALKALSPAKRSTYFKEIGVSDPGALDAWLAPTKEEIGGEKYKNDRRKGYGLIGDQLDMQYWDSVNGTTVWRDHVAAVKAKYPKP